MKFVALAEFQSITGLSDGALLQLLKKNELCVQTDGEKGLLIDVDAAELQTLIRAMAAKQQDLLADKKTLIAERFARIISDHLEQVIEEAIGNVLASEGARDE